MRERIEAALERIRPVLRADGGDVQLVDVSPAGVVQVRLSGGCRTCVMSRMTLKNGIERIIQHEVPEILSVEAV